jgi:hypothetical protein
MKIIVGALVAFLLGGAFFSQQAEARCWWNGYNHCRYYDHGWWHHGWYHQATGIANVASEEGKREGDITVTEMELAKNLMNYSSSDC